MDNREAVTLIIGVIRATQEEEYKDQMIFFTGISIALSDPQIAHKLMDGLIEDWDDEARAVHLANSDQIAAVLREKLE